MGVSLGKAKFDILNSILSILFLTSYPCNSCLLHRESFSTPIVGEQQRKGQFQGRGISFFRGGGLRRDRVEALCLATLPRSSRNLYHSNNYLYKIGALSQKPTADICYLDLNTHFYLQRLGLLVLYSTNVPNSSAIVVSNLIETPIHTREIKINTPKVSCPNPNKDSTSNQVCHAHQTEVFWGKGACGTERCSTDEHQGCHCIETG